MASKLIGGIFPSTTILSNHLYLTNVRSALFVLNEMFSPKTVWLPNYYCPSMLLPFNNCRFYTVNEQLKPNLNFKPEKNDFVIAINYFGYQTSNDVLKFAKDNNAIAIEDSAQSLLPKSKYADFTLYGSRKHFPVPDGCVVVSRNKIACRAQEAPCKAFYLPLMGMDYRKSNEHDNQTWYELSKQSKIDMPMGNYSMSSYSRNVLDNIDKKGIIKRKKQNCESLLSLLKDIALFDKVVPAVGFPVIINNRDYVRSKLIENNIFCPSHWDVKHELSKKILILPCDQRYDENDMKSIAGFARNFKG